MATSRPGVVLVAAASGIHAAFTNFAADLVKSNAGGRDHRLEGSHFTFQSNGRSAVALGVERSAATVEMTNFWVTCELWFAKNNTNHGADSNCK